MNKQELQERIAHELNITGKESRTIVETVVNTISEGLVEDSKVIIKGLESWHLKKRAKRKARNLNTGEAVTVPRRNAVAFTPSKDLVSLINRTPK